MPSKITTIYDALVTKLTTLWPNALQIANFADLTQVESTSLADGFAIAIGPSVNTANDLSKQERFTRDIVIIRTMRVTPAETDNNLMGDTVKTMLEDQYSLRQALRIDNMLNDTCSDIGFQSDGGIEYLETENGFGRFFVLSSLFSLTYIEDFADD